MSTTHEFSHSPTCEKIQVVLLFVNSKTLLLQCGMNRKTNADKLHKFCHLFFKTKCSRGCYSVALDAFLRKQHRVISKDGGRRTQDQTKEQTALFIQRLKEQRTNKNSRAYFTDPSNLLSIVYSRKLFRNSCRQKTSPRCKTMSWPAYSVTQNKRGGKSYTKRA